MLTFTKKIPLSAPTIEEMDIAAVIEVLKSGWLAQGPKVQAFEERFASSHQANYAVAVNSATSGLHIALLALEVGPGDEVIVPAFTWVATANVVELCGATPVFVDIELHTFNASLVQILQKITPRTKAIIPVHLFGKPFDVEQLQTQLPRPIAIVADAACAAGATLRSVYCGTLGDAAVFSFHPRKSITTGEGGMITTNCKSLYQKLLMLRNHGQQIHSSMHPADMADCPIYGLNYRMTDIQGALGLTQLKRLDRFIQRREELVQVYFENLRDLKEIQLPQTSDEERHAWQTFAILLKEPKRRAVIEYLREKGIETRPGTHAVHTLSYYQKKYAIEPCDYPNALTACTHTIALPLHNQMLAEECVYVSKYLKEAIHA